MRAALLVLTWKFVTIRFMQAGVLDATMVNSGTDTVPATPNFSPQKYVASASRGHAARRPLLLGCRHCAFLTLSPRTLRLIS
jgi:hypothetical protein